MKSICRDLKAPLLLIAVFAPFGAAHAEGAAPPGAVNILTLQPRTGDADYSATINKAAAAGKVLFLPNTGKPYLVTDALDFPAPGGGLVGEKGVTLAVNHKKTIFRIRAANITFRDIMFDGEGMGKNGKGEAYCVARGFKWEGGGMRYGGPTFLQAGCDDAALSGLTYEFDESTAFTVQARNVSITGSRFMNNVGFAITVGSGAENFRFDGDATRSNGLEFVGVAHGARTGEIANNIVDGVGDNCISISGDDVKVTGNTLKHCLGHGVGVYGSDNIVTGNKIVDAGQVYNSSAKPIPYWNGSSKAIYHSPSYFLGSYAGVKIVDGSGGLGQHNLVANNEIIDDQASPTQDGIAIARQASGNTVGPNTIRGYRTYAVQDMTASHDNRLIGHP